jgi:hypothetical protein
MNSLDIKTKTPKKSFMQKVLNVVIPAIAILVIAFIPGSVGAAALYLGTAGLIMAGGTMMLANSGLYAQSRLLGKMSTMVGMVATFVGIGNIVTSMFTQPASSAATASAAAANTSIDAGVAGTSEAFLSAGGSSSVWNTLTAEFNKGIMEGLSAAVKKAANYITDYVTDYVVDIASNFAEGTVTSTLKAIASTLDGMMKGVKLYFKVVNPYEDATIKSTNGNGDADTPSKPGTFDEVMEYSGGSSFRGIFELPEEIDASYPMMSHEGMCSNVGNKYYS